MGVNTSSKNESFFKSVTLLLHLAILTNKKAFVYKASCTNGADYRSRVIAYYSYQNKVNRAIFSRLWQLIAIFIDK